MKPDPSSANIPTGEATVSVPPSDLPQQVETADVAMNGASLDDITDELGSLDGETGEEIQDQRPNTTVIDEKVESETLLILQFAKESYAYFVIDCNYILLYKW